MREQNRQKKKVQFALDGKQVIILFTAAMLILAGIFSMGVMVGKRLGNIADKTEKSDLLAELDEQEVAYQKKKEELEKSKAATETDEKKKEAPAKAEKKGESEKDEAKKAEEDVKRKVEEAKRLAEAKKKEVEEKKRATAEAKKRAEEEKKRKKEAEVEKEDKTVSASGQTKAPDGKKYSLQIASLPSRERADQFIKEFKPFDKRKPFIVPSAVPGKGTWHRVKIGRFETKEQAMAYQSIFESKTGIRTILALE